MSKSYRSAYRRRVAPLVACFLLLGVLCSCTDKTPVEAPASPTPPPRDTSGDTSLSASMVYANTVANSVQAWYSDSQRSAYTMENQISQFEHSLTTGDNKGITYFNNASGKTYFENTMDLYVRDAQGKVYYDRASTVDAYVNTTRLGYYYYETHIRDLKFMASQSEMKVENERNLSNFANGTWGTHDVSLWYDVNKSLTATINSVADPYFYLRGINVPLSEVNVIMLTMSVSGSSTTASLYFCDSETNNFNGTQNVSFAVNNDGKEHTYLIDIGDLLQGNLTGVRIDIGSVVGETVTVTSVKSARADTSPISLRLDKTYHIYPDKLHQEFIAVANNKVDNITEYGLELRIAKDKVTAVQFRDSSGTSTSVPFESSSAEYVALHVRDAGVVGLIIPAEGSNTGSVSVTEEDGYYVIRQRCSSSLTVEKGERISFSNRLYNDETDNFDTIDAAAAAERNPMTGVEIVDTNANVEFVGYDGVRGMYRFTGRGTNFTTAYYKRNHNRYYSAEINFTNNNYARTAYIWINSSSGAVECAAMLDDTKTLMPVPIQVCKNFIGEYEEPFYDPEDKDYGDSIYPLVFKAEEKTNITSMQLYQNWGAYPLKQLSSIQFHVSYYHLSTGVTESNCIAPYYVYGRDGWTLPDFRGCSGDMWASQPQFNSVGITNFITYNSSNGNKNVGEYTGSMIYSSGQTYADVEYSYISDCGSYEYTMRHVEFPQNDENRTYYSMDLTFLKDLTIDDARKNFSLFMFNGRYVMYNRMSYKNENGEKTAISLDLGSTYDENIKLSSDTPFFSLYGLRGENASASMNMSYIMRNSEIKINGKEWNGNFLLRNTFDGTLNHVYLTLDTDSLNFKKGDTIKLDFILLPWGTLRDTEDPNTDYVIADSVINPLKVTAQVGEVVPDTYLARVITETNEAEFTLSGSRNRNVVRVDGFTSLKRPTIQERQADGTWVDYVTNVEAYDGYTAHYNVDGTYGFSFVVEMDDNGSERQFRVSAN